MFCALLSVERFFLLFRALFSATPSTFLSVEHFFVIPSKARNPLWIFYSDAKIFSNESSIPLILS